MKSASPGVTLKPNPATLTGFSFTSLGLLFLPPIGFAACLLAVSQHPRFLWLSHLSNWPWQLWLLLVAGTIATAGGVGDWWFHKVWITVGPNEHNAHLAALGGGGAVFIFMCAASLAERPQLWLLPVVVALIVTVLLIAYDEFVFHRRCTAHETRLHRMLTLGNGVAFLCWFHWLFV